MPCTRCGSSELHYKQLSLKEYKQVCGECGHSEVNVR